VLDVPPKLPTRARIFDTGHGRKNDHTDARTIAVVALRANGLRRVEPGGERVALKLLSERRRQLVRSRTQTINRLHRRLMELLFAGAAKDLTAVQAKTLLAKVRPRDVARRTRRQLAVDLIDDVTVLDRKVADLDKRLPEAVAATGTSLTRRVEIGPVSAALILTRPATSDGSAASITTPPTTGTTPREVSSGDIQRHRLS
jgi:transposase